MKNRLKGAQRGHSLLKNKTDALNSRYREIMKQIVEVQSVGLQVAVAHVAIQCIENVAC